MINLMKTEKLLDLTKTLAKEYFEKCEYPWQILPKIGDMVIEIGKNLDKKEYTEVEKNVWVSNSAKIFPNTYIAPPCIIGHNTEVRPGAFIRGSVLVGENCVVGNSTELKNVVLFNNVQVPHYNYVGDSVLGYKAHTGAGAITSNVKQDKSLISVNFEKEKEDTGLKKFGAILGDNVEIGCNTVMNPGTVVGRGSRVYPLSMVRGFVKENHIYKTKGEVAEILDI